MGGLAIPIAQAPRFADRLEAWGAASLFAGSIFSLSIALPPSAVPWHAALVRFWASPNVLGATAGFRDQQVPSRANGSFGHQRNTGWMFWLIYDSQAL
jgi:hypothetical protein